jgi:proline iminopeptidase
VADLYPAIEPFATGWLEAGDGNQLYWESCGSPAGNPAVVLHGGPGSGASPWFRRLFDPGSYRVSLFDQRNCGRSRPHASDPSVALDRNTTAELLGDIERLREKLEVDRWLVVGGSWGSVLGLAYAEAHPDRVTGLIVFGTTSGRRSEVDWLFRGGLARFFPQQWSELKAAVNAAEDAQVVEACWKLLEDPDPDVRRRAATAWCLWESATPHWPPASGLDKRFQDPDYAMAFARIVTHYVRHDLFLADGALLEGAGALADIPGVIVHGRFDFQSPLQNAWDLHEAWPRSRLVVVADAGHAAGAEAGRQIVAATDEFR